VIRGVELVKNNLLFEDIGQNLGIIISLPVFYFRFEIRHFGPQKRDQGGRISQKQLAVLIYRSIFMNNDFTSGILFPV
jgi:hypothetical protein